MEDKEIVHLCFNAWIKQGYYNPQIGFPHVGELLFEQLDAGRGDGRIVFDRIASSMPLHDRLCHLLAVMGTRKHDDASSLLAQAKQFAILLNDDRSSFNPHVGTDKEVLLSKKNIEGILEFLWWLYEVHNSGKKEVVLTVVCEDLGLDELFEIISTFDSRAKPEGSFQAYVESFLKDQLSGVCLYTPRDLQAEAMLPKPPELEWSEPSPPNERCRYDHVCAQTPFGELLIEWKSHKDHTLYSCCFPFGDERFDPGVGLMYINEHTLEDAKAKVYEFYVYYVRRALGHTVRKPRC